MSSSRSALLLAVPIILALVAFTQLPGNPAAAATEVRSTVSGGSWTNAATWEGGVAPSAGDSAVVVAGSVVLLDHVGEATVGWLSIEDGGTLEMQGDAELNVENDARNQGTILSRGLQWGRIRVFGAFRGEGVGARDNLTFAQPNLDLYGDVYANATTYAQIDLLGTNPRTIWLEDPAEPLNDPAQPWAVIFLDQVALIGENRLHSEVVVDADLKGKVVARAGSSIRWSVSPNATVQFPSLMFQAETDGSGEVQFINHAKSTIELAGEGGAYDFSFRFLDAQDSDTLRAESYAGQTHPAFAASVPRWWRLEATDNSQNLLSSTKFYFTHDEFLSAGVDKESLRLYHSSDQGATWTFYESSGVPSGPGDYGWVSVIENIPASGDYVIAGVDPLASAATGPELILEIGGPGVIRIGAPTDYFITYSNPGTTNLGRGLMGIHVEGGPYFTFVRQSSPPYTTFLPGDDVFAPPIDGLDEQSALLITPPLGPGESRTVHFQLWLDPSSVSTRTTRHQATIPIQLLTESGNVGSNQLADAVRSESSGSDPLSTFSMSSVDNPVVRAGVQYTKAQITSWFEKVTANAIREGLQDPCLPANLDNIQRVFDRAIEETNSEFSGGEFSYIKPLKKWANVLDEAGTFKNGFKAADAINKGNKAANSISKGFKYVETIGCPDYTPLGDGPAAVRRSELEPVQSWDPNAKYGAVGIGEAGFVRSIGRAVYRISFENKAEATAAAFRVNIVDTLSSVFDLSTIERIGESHEGFTFSLDGSVLTWDIQGIELPPNQNPPEGEGYVDFAVGVIDGLTTGTVIDNDATIVFDQNEPIRTNLHVNTLDEDAPTATIDPLPATVGGTATLSWNAQDQDGGSGYESVNIFGSIDGGPADFLLTTGGTSFDYPVQAGRNYEFYVLARDSVGNMQADILAKTTTTATAVGVVDLGDSGFDLAPSYPNPFQETATIDFKVPTNDHTQLVVYDVLGREVSRLIDRRMPSGTHRVSWDGSRLANGIYFLRLKHGQNAATRAATVVR